VHARREAAEASAAAERDAIENLANLTGANPYGDKRGRGGGRPGPPRRNNESPRGGYSPASPRNLGLGLRPTGALAYGGGPGGGVNEGGGDGARDRFGGIKGGEGGVGMRRTGTGFRSPR
jgi:hypothetical protein